jgi:teichuronic acid biosynthesis glycosyltransferase TuaG|tara:strand:- start:3693 stop:4442 length:750 start_codon:yes stop_codon:yes gene_type:complete
MKELISIIIPYFKKKKYLEKTIQSVVKQTYQKFEVILIYDDIDNSDLKFVKYTLRKIKNKKIIINKKNLGVGMSRNLGIKIAQGKFIAFLDADDTWHKDKIKEQVIYMKKNKVDFSYSSYAISDKNMKMLKMIKAPKKVMFKDLLFACNIGLSSVMIKAYLLKYDKFTSLKTQEDYLLWLKLSRRNIKMEGITKTLMYWRKTDNSLSSSAIQKLKDAFSIYNKHLNLSIIKSTYHVLLLSMNFLRKRYL